MRPTARPQSAFRTPLNRILGTEVNVRVLRELSDASSPIAPAELARRTRLERSSVHRALQGLEGRGIIEFTEPPKRVALRSDSALGKALEALFCVERERYSKLIAGLRRISATLTPPPISVWIQGPVALGVDEPADPVIVGMIDNARSLAATSETMRKKLERLEKKLDVTIEVRGMTLTDMDIMPARARAAVKGAIPLAGVPPEGLLKRSQRRLGDRNLRVHGDHDARAHLLGEQIAEALDRDPSLVVRARAYVEDRWQQASVRERKELEEWRRILRSSSPARLRTLLTDPGERATRLRQSLPFIGLLGPER
jgi:DNA-binding MarR family transcriptional regulator